MPFYDYHCDACDADTERLLPMSQHDSPQTCADCGGALRKRVTAPMLNFPGDDWATKNDRVARQMAAKNAKLTVKQDERKREQPHVTLAPNVNGERVGSWSEAQKLAGSLGKDTSSYDSKVRSEQAAKK